MVDPVKFLCPHCQYEMELHSAQMARTVPCPSCDRPIDTPSRDMFEALGAAVDHADSAKEDGEPRPLHFPHFVIGCILPGLMIAYGLGFGVLQRKFWFGAREYGGGGNVVELMGDPALIMGTGFTLAGTGLHLSGIWVARYPTRIPDRLATFIASAGVVCILAALILSAVNLSA